MAQNCVRDRDQGEDGGDARGEEAVIAEGVENEGLQIKQPESDREHNADEQREERSEFRGAESGEERGAERSEIGECAEGSEWDGTYRRILAAEHLLAATRGNALRCSSGHMLDGQINSIRQTEQGDDCGNGIKTFPKFRRRRERSSCRFREGHDLLGVAFWRTWL